MTSIGRPASNKKISKKTTNKKKGTKRSIEFSSSSYESDVDVILSDSTDLELNDEKNICCICSGQYLKNVEDWIKCVCQSCRFVIPRMPLAVVLALTKDGLTKLAQMIVKYLYVNTAFKISLQMIDILTSAFVEGYFAET